jgi:adenosylmethionine-8-amino-7-oxononanoate aminotransferase
VLRKYGIPLVADEVICGLGRTGRLLGTQTYDIEPDILITSKCLTAGYFPLGAILVSGEIDAALEAAAGEFGEFPHGFTTAAHPVGCAVGVKAIDVILNEGIFDNVGRVSPHFLERLHTLSRHPHVGETRGVGLMGAIELVQDKEDKSPFPAEAAIGERIANTALEHGLICRPIGQAIVLAPPFIITPAEVDELFDKLESTMAKVLKGEG